MIDNRIVGKTIAMLRQSKGMTQQQLAAAMNVSHQAVSKWENGAALPDIQTLVELTRLFGVTIEQLLSGSIPTNHEEEPQPDPLREIGRFVNEVTGSIGSLFSGSKGNNPDEFISEEHTECENVEAVLIDLDMLLNTAPFMSRSAVSDMLLKHTGELSAEDFARFAPFVTPDCLEKLIRRHMPTMDWQTLKTLAPFLRRGFVDELAREITKVRKPESNANTSFEKAAGDVCKAIDDVSRKIGEGVDKAVRKVVSFGESVAGEVGRVIEDLTREPETREERLVRLRRTAFEKALDENRWEWLEAHIDEITDDDLRARIAEKAMELGMEEWVRKNMSSEDDEKQIEEAVKCEDWSWIDANFSRLPPDKQLHIAICAADKGKWSWIDENCAGTDLSGCANELMSHARQSDNCAAVRIVFQRHMQPVQRETFVLEMLRSEDFDCIKQLFDLISTGMLSSCCVELAKDGVWVPAVHYFKEHDDETQDRLLEIAIEAGDFDMIDRLNDLINNNENGAANNE